MPKSAKGVGADSNGRWVGVGGLMKRLSRCGASGCTCIEPWTDRATLWSSFSVGHVASQRRRGEGAIAPDVGIQDVLQCATCHYRHRASAEDSQTPVRNSDPMAVESHRDLASCHGSIVRIAAAYSWSYRSDNPICTRTLDRAVDRLYRAKGFASEHERVEHLFMLYEKIRAPLAAAMKAKPKRRRTLRSRRAIG